MSMFDDKEISIRVSEEDGKILAEFTPAADFPPFHGHFPGNPIFPGIAHISLVTEILSRAAGAAFVLENVKRVKFLAPALPEKRLSVEVTSRPGETEGSVEVEAVIRTEGKKISVLKLQYRRTAA